MIACMWYNASKEVIELLIANGADVNEKDNDNRTPLMLAKEFNAPKEVVELLEKKIIEAQFAALKKANVNMEQKLAKLERENVKLKQQLAKLEQESANKGKKIYEQRMTALMPGEYSH